MPIKLNRNYWKSKLLSLLPSAYDPSYLASNEPVSDEQFTQAVSSLNFGGIYKTTKKNRYPLTFEKILNLDLESDSIILDIGASDGMASLDLLKKLKFKKYYVTDKNIQVKVSKDNNSSHFYDVDGNPILTTFQKFIIYSDTEGAWFPFNIIADKYLPKEKGRDFVDIVLVNPEIIKLKEEKSEIEICCFDIFSSWEKEKADLIVAANILNPTNFSLEQFDIIFSNLNKALKPDSKIVIIDNRGEVETSTGFKFDGNKYEVLFDVGAGAEIKSLFLAKNNQ